MFGTWLKTWRKSLILHLLILQCLDRSGLENSPFTLIGWFRNACGTPTGVHPCRYATEASPHPVIREFWHIIRRRFDNLGLFQDLRADALRYNSVHEFALDGKGSSGY